jgi:hypothetical protein
MFVADLLPRSCTTASDEYRALHREARSLARDGIIEMVTLPRGRKRAAVGPAGQPLDLDTMQIAYGWPGSGASPREGRGAALGPLVLVLGRGDLDLPCHLAVRPIEDLDPRRDLAMTERTRPAGRGIQQLIQ